MGLLLAMEAAFSRLWSSLSEPRLGGKGVDGWAGRWVKPLLLVIPFYPSIHSPFFLGPLALKAISVRLRVGGVKLNAVEAGLDTACVIARDIGKLGCGGGFVPEL
jgi:hypothetical protein